VVPLQEEQGLSFVEGMVSSYIDRMEPDQKREALRVAVDQMLTGLSAAERMELLRDALRALAADLPVAERQRLTAELTALLRG
jgi:hypothetical protein